MSKPSPIWHPFTQHAVTPKMLKINSASGAYLQAEDGRKILDAISSWWVVTHGHCHPKIIDAIKVQAAKLDQVIFAGHTHDPAQELAQRLVDITPKGLEYVFFSDSGSTAVEVALKMALSFWKHSSDSASIERNKIVVMESSYHGDTIGTMSVGERGVFNKPYDPLMFDVGKVPFPQSGNEQLTLDALEHHCAKGDVAAFIVEPLILGAGGMLMYTAQTLAQMHKICKSHDVLFIADEVMTGWGRTGKMFACEYANITPDIVCYSKGITGGSLPLAVTMCHSKIYDAHYSTDRSKTFFHSSSYTANPIACAAAVANLKIWEDEPVLKRIEKLGVMQQKGLDSFASDGRFTNTRQLGAIGAVDIVAKDEGYLANIGPKLYEFFQKKNILLRPLGNTIYVMPPYCVNDDEMNSVFEAIADAADTLL